jgi:hypothetical protein
MARLDPQQSTLAAMQSFAQSAIQKCVDGKDYDDTNVESWCKAIVSQVLQMLRPGRTPQYKFIASCMILSTRTQYVTDMSMALYDGQNDLRITTKWSNETMQCIVSVWAFRTRHNLH